MTDVVASLGQLNIIVRNMDASLAFYRDLGLRIEAKPGAEHVAVRFESGFLLELDTVEFAAQWDSGYRGATGGSSVIGFGVPSREVVDATHARLVAAGNRTRQRPYDAFWGARYAIVEDPDGNPVGLMSPIDDGHKSWPPTPPPA